MSMIEAFLVIMAVLGAGLALVGGTVFAAYVIVSELVGVASRRTSARTAVPVSPGGRVVSMAEFKRPARVRTEATSDRAKAA